MKQGYKIQHRYFTPDEFLRIDGDEIICESGYSMTTWWYGNRQDSEWKLDGYRVLPEGE